MRSNDPDALQCYSDHASDIAYSGLCSMCGSDDPEVVEHVLPEVPRISGLDPVEAARKVLDSQTAMMFDGVLFDTFSASHVVAVADALSPANLATLRSWPLVKAVEACFQLVAKAGAQ